jgi:copper transport protein
VPAVAVATSAQQPSAGLQLLVGIANGLLSLGLVAAVGLVPAGLLLGADPGERRILWRAARGGAGLSILASILQAVAQYFWQGSAVPGGADWSGLGPFAGSGYAETVLVRIGVLGLALVALPPLRVVERRPRLLNAWWAGEALLVVAVLGTVVLNGHGGNGVWWQFVSTLIHVSAVAAWLGGLAVLGWLVLRRRISVRRLLRLPLWSRYAAASVGLLALTGLVQGLVQVRHPAALISTTYGYVLVVKLLLVAAALLLGLWGNRWISHYVAVAGERPADDVDGRIAPGETARLRGRVRVEAGFGALIVVVSGLLSSVTPAAAAYAPRRVIDTTIGPYAVTIEVAPARRGPQSFRITAQGATEATAPAQSVQLDLGRRSGAVRALPVIFRYRLSGKIVVGRPTGFTFVSSSVSVPETGAWTGTLTLVAGPLQQYTGDFTYRVV